MAERLCGMANAQGGMIIIGVEDVECKVVGVSDERMAMTKDVILRAARQIIKPALVLDPTEPEIYKVDGKQLVVAMVPPNNGSVYQSGGVFWVRRGTPILRPQEPQVSKTLWDEDEQLSALPTSTEGLSDKEQRLEKAILYVQEHGFITNSLYRDITGVTDKRAFRDLGLLIERGSLKRVGSKRGRRYELP